MNIACLSILVLLVICVTASHIKVASVYVHKDGKHEIVDALDKDAADAFGNLEDKFETEGFYRLHIRAPGRDASAEAYAAGVLEGHLLAQQIHDHVKNQIDDNKYLFDGSCAAIDTYMTENYNFLLTTSAEKRDGSDYWRKVYLMMRQLQGVASGYADSGLPAISVMEIFKVNMLGETDDLQGYLCPAHATKDIDTTMHCTGAVRLLPDNADILFSHDTWSGYSTMLRVMKDITLPSHTANDAVSFSSYPGVLFSMDDFYLTDQLAVIETTFHCFNQTAYDVGVDAKSTVPTWLRAQVANALAMNGPEWAQLFQDYNSGTYNNQWTIVDYKLFKPHHDLLPSTITRLEQMPALCAIEDATAELQRVGWIASINAPAMKVIQDYSGYSTLPPDDAKYFAYKQQARYAQFTHEADKINSYADFRAFMRHNDYKNDQWTNNDPGSAIASRYDLRPAPYMGHAANAFGCTDSKTTNAALAATRSFDVIIGPTTDGGLPAWSYSAVAHRWPVPHRGIPDNMSVFNFELFSAREPYAGVCFSIFMVITGILILGGVTCCSMVTVAGVFGTFTGIQIYKDFKRPADEYEGLSDDVQGEDDALMV